MKSFRVSYIEMADKRFIVQCAHFAAIAVALVILCALSSKVLFYFTGTANLMLCVFVAYNTFRFSKRWFLDEWIRPDNKAVFITGCDSGFGNAVAKRLDSKGFHVFASCLFPDGEGATDLKLSCSSRMRILQLDVTKDDSVQEALSFFKNNLGSNELWALVNNAGVYKGLAVDFTCMEDYQVCMDVNCFGTVRVTKAFLPMIKKSRGRVVNITSAAARLPVPDTSAYSMSKHAVLNFTDCLDQEMGAFGIKVISIEPECFYSAMFSKNNLSRIIDEAFSKVSEDTLATYEEGYFDKVMNAYMIILRMFANRKSDVVIDGIERAISEKYPDHVYKPRVSMFTRCFYYTTEIIPYELFTVLSSRCKQFIGFTPVSPRL